MEGIIVNYRRSRHSYTGNQLIVELNSVKSKDDALKLVGKKVTYNTGKKDIVGEIRSNHGNKGAVRVLFKQGMPGQAIGKKVTIN